MPYNSKQDAINAAMGEPGWISTGEAPNLVEVANPLAGRPGEPAKISQAAGIKISVRGPTGAVDDIVIKEVGNNPNTKGGVGFDLVQGPQKNIPKPATSSPQATWVRIDASGKEVGPNDPAVAIRDPNAAPGTQPFRLEEDQKLGDPSTWQAITNPNDPNKAVIGLYDPKTSKLAATVPAAPNRQPTGQFTNFIDPNDPTGKRVIAVIDQGDLSIHPVAQIDGKQIVTTQSAIYVVDKDTGKSVKVQDIDRSAPFQAVVTDGVRYIFDPNEKDPSKAYRRDPNQGKLAPTMKGSDGTDWVLVEDPNDPSGLGGHYVRPPGITKASTVDAPGAAALEFIIYRDENGNEVSRSKNPNWQGYPQPAEPTISTTARTVPRWNREKGVWEDVPNTNRIVASEALRNMAQQLTGQVVAGDISEDEAAKLITAANAKMANDIAQQNAVANAAQNVLSTTAQGAQTGAGILNQRAATAANLVQSGLGLIQSSGGRYGNYSGGILNPVPGFGADLVQGAADFATGLGGGQAVYDTAVRMVQAADPNGGSPERSSAVAALTQMMSKYQEATGREYPTVAATRAAQASQVGGGLPAPVTTAPVINPAIGSPSVFQAQFDPRYNAAFPQQPVGTVLPTGVTGTVPLDDPRRLRPRTPAELAAMGGWAAPVTV